VSGIFFRRPRENRRPRRLASALRKKFSLHRRCAHTGPRRYAPDRLSVRVNDVRGCGSHPHPLIIVIRDSMRLRHRSRLLACGSTCECGNGIIGYMQRFSWGGGGLHTHALLGTSSWGDRILILPDTSVLVGGNDLPHGNSFRLVCTVCSVLFSSREMRYSDVESRMSAEMNGDDSFGRSSSCCLLLFVTVELGVCHLGVLNGR